MNGLLLLHGQVLHLNFNILHAVVQVIIGRGERVVGITPESHETTGRYVLEDKFNFARIGHRQHANLVAVHDVVVASQDDCVQINVQGERVVQHICLQRAQSRRNWIYCLQAHNRSVWVG